jgi:hypothetical protein
MKRAVILTLLVVAVASSSGCRRGLRCWGLRGDRCGTPYAPSAPPAYAPPPAYAAPPAYAPPACPPTYSSSYPIECPPYVNDPCYSSGIPSAPFETQPYDPGAIPGGTTPPTTNDGVYIPGSYPGGTVMYSKPVGDRVIVPTLAAPLPRATLES